MDQRKRKVRNGCFIEAEWAVLVNKDVAFPGRYAGHEPRLKSILLSETIFCQAGIFANFYKSSVC